MGQDACQGLNLGAELEGVRIKAPLIANAVAQDSARSDHDVKSIILTQVDKSDMDRNADVAAFADDRTSFREDLLSVADSNQDNFSPFGSRRQTINHRISVAQSRRQTTLKPQLPLEITPEHVIEIETDDVEDSGFKAKTVNTSPTISKHKAGAFNIQLKLAMDSAGNMA